VGLQGWLVCGEFGERGGDVVEPVAASLVPNASAMPTSVTVAPARLARSPCGARSFACRECRHVRVGVSCSCYKARNAMRAAFSRDMSMPYGGLSQGCGGGLVVAVLRQRGQCLRVGGDQRGDDLPQRGAVECLFFGGRWRGVPVTPERPGGHRPGRRVPVRAVRAAGVAAFPQGAVSQPVQAPHPSTYILVTLSLPQVPLGLPVPFRCLDSAVTEHATWPTEHDTWPAGVNAANSGRGAIG
jgi:hypothetical protein